MAAAKAAMRTTTRIVASCRDTGAGRAQDPGDSPWRLIEAKREKYGLAARGLRAAGPAPRTSRYSIPGTPATQSGLPLTFRRRSGISGVAEASVVELRGLRKNHRIATYRSMGGPNAHSNFFDDGCHIACHWKW